MLIVGTVVEESNNTSQFSSLRMETICSHIRASFKNYSLVFLDAQLRPLEGFCTIPRRFLDCSMLPRLNNEYSKLNWGTLIGPTGFGKLIRLSLCKASIHRMENTRKPYLNYADVRKACGSPKSETTRLNGVLHRKMRIRAQSIPKNFTCDRRHILPRLCH